jgi:AcrR family transcriptional regulator
MNTNKKTTGSGTTARSRVGTATAEHVDRVERIPARDRLLAAAGELFYEEDFNTVGIDRVIERAGVAKASLYDCFGSKDELIRAYLMQRHESRVARIVKGFARYDTARDRLLGIFDILDEICGEPGFRGCAFVKAGANASSTSSAKAICDASRQWMFELMLKLAGEAGARDPNALALQLRMLYDGAAVAAQMDLDLAAPMAARAMAASLLDASIMPVEPASIHSAAH